MLLISASLRPSDIHGIGCFADERVTKGQLVWVFDDRIDMRIPVSELPTFPKPAQEFLRTYGYEELHDGQRVIVLCGDHAKHMNHSNNPNLSEVTGNVNVAERDIESGEELTCNYHEFDSSADKKLSKPSGQ